MDATGAQTIKVANATDVMMGDARHSATTDAAVLYATDDTSDTISMNGTTTGGLKGAYVVCDDVKAGFWAVRVLSESSGVGATPFSATECIGAVRIYSSIF